MVSATLQFIADFRGLHDKVRNGSISLPERAKYLSGRGKFVHIVQMSQLVGQAGQTLRSELRMSKMLKVELRPDVGETERLTTLDIATKGFAALVPKGLPVGSTAAFTLFLPKPASPITGRVTVASARPHGGAVKTSFTFVDLLPQMAEQLDIALIDAILERLTKF